MRAIDRFNKFSKPLHNGQDQLKNLIFDNYPVLKIDDYCNLDKVYEQNFDSDYVWLVDKNIKVFDSFPWWFKPRSNDIIQIHEFPYVYKESRKIKCWDKVRLVPTKKTHHEPRQHIHICGEYDVYKGNNKFDCFYIGKNQEDINTLQKTIPHLQTVKTWHEAQERSYTDMFWVIWDDIDIRNTFKFSFKPDEWSHDFVHVFGNGDIDQLDGVALFPKNYKITEKELEHRFYVNKKEIRIMASTPKKYETFTIDNYKDYENALNKSTYNMFYGVPSDVEIDENFNFDYNICHHDKSLRKQNHVFLNKNKYNGIVLFSKDSIVTKKEIAYRFVVNPIETNIVASKPKPIDVFTINSFEDYEDAFEKSKSHVFLGVPDDVILDKDFDINDWIADQKTLDTGTTHLFLNDIHYDGVALFSKSFKVTKKEINHRFLVSKKEHSILASTPRPYEKFKVDNYDEYLQALQDSKTDMFWIIPSDVNVKETFNFDLYFSHHNKFDKEINHVFLNGEQYDGIALLSKQCVATEKEINHRFFVNKKEHEIIASTPKPFDKFIIKNYDDYLQAREKTTTGMFWIIYHDIDVVKDFDFSLYISHHNQYERKINHVWKNGEYYDGVALVTKNIILTKHEIDYRFLAVKKEYDTIGSYPAKYDIVFISNGESNADKNFVRLVKAYPQAKRVDKVKGIHQAHIEAAKLVNIEMFWVVDGDAELLEDFELDYQIAYYDIDGKRTVYVWRSMNPINGLVYGYGGVKLLPTKLTLNMDTNTPDMTTSISKNFKGIPRMSNVTAFNTDSFSAWRSGFRECVKLSSRTINRQKDDETTFRLRSWCSRGQEKEFGPETIAGAYEGAKYGIKWKNNPDALKKINDFEWLKKRFKDVYPPESFDFDLDFLDYSEEESLKAFNPIVSTMFKEIENKLGKNYKFQHGSIKLSITNVGDLYWDKRGVRVSSEYADAEITTDLKTGLKLLKMEEDSVEMYKRGDILLEGDADLAILFFNDLKQQVLRKEDSKIALHRINLSSLIDYESLNIQINITDVGAISVDSEGIVEKDNNKANSIECSQEIFEQILENELSVVDALQEKSANYNGDILEVIKLSQQLAHREIHE